MKEKCYRNFNTGLIILKEDAQDYALEQLGLKIEYLEGHTDYTQEQYEFLDSLEDWYFSAEWEEDEIDKSDIPYLEYIY